MCGDDVREVLHDGHPTACVADAAFAYVNTFKSHMNVGFFRGAEIADPAHLLQGTGKLMRHVKITPRNSPRYPSSRDADRRRLRRYERSPAAGGAARECPRNQMKESLCKPIAHHRFSLWRSCPMRYNS